MLARWFTSEEDVPLRGVRRVEVGVYEVADLRSGVEEPRPITLPDLPDWQTVVHVSEDNEDVYVLAREKDEKLRGLLIIVAEDDEWVLVRIKGKLQHMVEDVMQMAFDHAERPDLYEPVLAEYQGAGEGDVGSTAD